MKQLLFLLLFPCLAMAQYQGNGNQKITLGEQTSADGLVYRGVANDTNVITPFSDTSAYIILDTVNSKFYHYNRTTTFWALAGGGVSVTSFSAGTTGLTPSTATTGAVTLGGTLAVANGGTGTGTAFTQGSVVFAGSDGNYRQKNTSLFFDSTYNRLNINKAGTGLGVIELGSRLSMHNGGFFITDANVNHGVTDILPNNSVFEGRKANSLYGGALFRGVNDSVVLSALYFQGINYNASATIPTMYFSGARKSGTSITSIANTDKILVFGNLATDRFTIFGDGKTLINFTTSNGAYPLQVNGQIFATNATIATSDEKFKENITPLNKGLEIVNKLKPVTFNFISNTENNFSEYEEVGFIAQDVDRALSTETFSKSIVKSADDSEPTSTMGLATQNLIPILVKAIQEQQALIKALEQRIINLENK